ncbi:hypothetical protein [Spirosoma koreense]
MKDEQDVKKEETQITGRTEGPFGTDDTDVDRAAQDNQHRADQENSVNGSDSQQIRGGQDGRNDRFLASTDMDSKNGILRMGDNANSTLEITQEGLDSAVAGDSKTNTAMVDVTTHGPDDYGSADQVGVPKAEEAAKKQNESTSDDQSQNGQSDEEELAETGTNLNNEPTY